MGSKHHLITDATGIPLAVTLTGGNCNDVTQLIPLLEAVPPVRGKRGRPRRRPDVVLADRGYDHDKYRRLVWRLGVKPPVARRGTEHGSGLGTQRWVVERAFAHLHWFRRLRIRWEVRDDIHEAILTPGCVLICRRRLHSSRRKYVNACREGHGLGAHPLIRSWAAMTSSPCSKAHAPSASMGPSNVSPKAVSSYSTRGGTSP